jgi:calcium-dependent protein kinase
MQEIKVMKKVNSITNPNLMRFVAAHEDIAATTGLPRLTIVTPLYAGGELFDRIVAKGHYTERDAAALLVKLSAAFLDLHANGILHRYAFNTHGTHTIHTIHVDIQTHCFRLYIVSLVLYGDILTFSLCFCSDLKPENVLYESKEETAEPILADFGLAKMEAAPEVHGGLVGTPGYIAPEIIRERLYTEAGDVWSLGVLAYILLCGYPPFYADNNAELYKQICAAAFEFHDDAWSTISEGAKDLVRKMLVADPKARMTMKDVSTHPWVTSLVPGPHLEKTIKNLRQFNARRKIKAAAAAVRLGGQLAVTRELAAVMPRTFLESEIAALSSAFHKLSGRSCVVNKEQFVGIMTSLGMGGLPLDRIFDVFDADGSGDIDYKELLCGLARLRSDSEDAVRMCFQIFDANGDGTLSLTELIRLLQSTGVADEAFTETGTTVSGAGSIGGLPEDAKERALEALFERIDANQDGSCKCSIPRCSLKTCNFLFVTYYIVTLQCPTLSSKRQWHLSLFCMMLSLSQ